MWSVVTDGVAWSVGLSVTIVSPAKTAYRPRCRLGCGLGNRNHVLFEDLDSPRKGAIFRGKGAPIVKYKDALSRAMEKRLNRSRCRLGFGMLNGVGPKKNVLDGGPVPPCERAILIFEGGRGNPS